MMTEVLAPMSPAEARSLDKRLRNQVRTYHDAARELHDAAAELMRLVRAAHDSSIHLTLGYASWPAYVADALKFDRQLPADKRKELVWLLTAESLSQRAIAAMLGVSKGTVQNDQTGQDCPVEVDSLDGKARPRKPREPWWTLPPPAPKKQNLLDELSPDDPLLKSRPWLKPQAELPPAPPPCEPVLDDVPVVDCAETLLDAEAIRQHVEERTPCTSDYARRRDAQSLRGWLNDVLKHLDQLRPVDLERLAETLRKAATMVEIHQLERATRAS